MHRVLVVDDEPQIAAGIRRILRHHYQVELADSGAAALERLPGFVPHVVISDFRMASMDGIEFLREVRQRAPSTVRILLSGYADVGADELISEGTVSAFLTKPQDVGGLCDFIRDALEGAQEAAT